jgi:hypothetical protein
MSSLQTMNANSSRLVVRAGAPPGNEDAGTWRGLGVMKVAGEQHFETDDTTGQRARWISFIASFLPIRRVRQWMGVLA